MGSHGLEVPPQDVGHVSPWVVAEVLKEGQQHRRHREAVGGLVLLHCSSSAQLLPSQAPDRRVTPRCPFDAPRYYKNGACASRASHRVAGRRPPRPSASLLRQAEVLHHLGSLAGGGAFVARLGRERRLQQRLDCDGRKEACGGNARRRSCASVFMVRWRRYGEPGMRLRLGGMGTTRHTIPHPPSRPNHHSPKTCPMRQRRRRPGRFCLQVVDAAPLCSSARRPCGPATGGTRPHATHLSSSGGIPRVRCCGVGRDRAWRRPEGACAPK